VTPLPTLPKPGACISVRSTADAGEEAGLTNAEILKHCQRDGPYGRGCCVVDLLLHDLTHHGRDSNKLAQLKIVELEAMKSLRGLLAKLKQTREADASLLDRTMVLYGSNLGNANSHDNRNLPILLAGGGFQHGQHLAFDPKNPPPLCNLYVTMLQRLGIEVDRFGSSAGTLPGLRTTN
jgi:hypothetical protein